MQINKDLPIHYRYNDYMYENGVHVVIKKYYPVRETNCFYFVVDEFEKHMLDVQPGRISKTKRVSKDGLRRFCYPSKELAMKSYKARKQSQYMHSKSNMEKAELALNKLNNIESLGEDFNLGKTDSYSKFIFD